MNAGSSLSVYDVDGRDRIHIEYLVIVPANVNVNEDILKKIYHINSGVCSGHSYLVPATIGALARILTNRE